MATEDTAVTTTAPAGTTVVTATTGEPATGEPAFPADTPVTEMTDAQQAAYWKAQSRKHETRSKNLGTPEEIKALKDAAAELDKLRAASMGETERAVAAAKAEATKIVTSEFALKLVAAELRAAVAGRIPADELAGLMEPVNFGFFLDDAGGIDTEKVTAHANKWVAGSKDASVTRFPDLGQGRRATTAKPSVETGRAAYEARKGSKTPGT